MSWKKIKFLAFILLISHGCAPIPKHDMASVENTCACSDAVSEALDTGVFILGDWPHDAWWEEFQDPILNKLIQDALALSPTLQRAEASLKAATQLALQRRAALFPEADLTANTNWQHLSKDGFFRAFAPQVPAVVNDIFFGLSFSYEFDFWGKNRDLFHAALGRASALAAERWQAEVILSTSIAYTYAELQFLLLKQKILSESLSNYEAISLIRKKRKINALDNATQQLDSDANALDIQAFLVDIQEEIEERLHKLKALSGMGQDAPLEISYRPLNPLQFALPSNLSLDLIARRPDLAAQKARVEAAAKEIGAAKTNFYPNVDLTAFLGFEAIHWNKLFRKKDYSGSFFPAINLPIFTAGRLKAELLEKVEDFNAAVFAYNELILKAAQEVADKLSDIALIQREIAVREQSLKTALEQEKHTQRRVQNAIDNQISLLHAKNTVLNKEIVLADLEYGKQLSGIQLIRALGGGYHE